MVLRVSSGRVAWLANGTKEGFCNYLIQENKTMKASKLCVLGSVFAACLAAGAETPDKFIRYVEATGQQAVDTGIVGRYGMRTEMQVEWMAVGGDTAFLDARGDDRAIFRAHALLLAEDLAGRAACAQLPSRPARKRTCRAVGFGEQAGVPAERAVQRDGAGQRRVRD